MPPADAPESARPASGAELARLLADAQRRGLKVSPRGGGTKADWGEEVERVDLVLSTLGLNRVLEHAAGDMTVTVEAGCTVAALQEAVARQGQRLALDPLWPERATVGGVLAANDSGPLRAAYGSLRDLVLGVTVALPDGTLARSGGKVVKNVAGYDLPKLMVGAFGTLGVITQATFRLHPLPDTMRTFRFLAPSVADATRFILALNDSLLVVAGLQVSIGSDVPCKVAVRVEGSASGTAASSGVLATIAAACGLTFSSEGEEPWALREYVWSLPGTIAKVTYLPSRLGELCASIVGAPWRLVAQGVGLGLLSINSPDTDVAEFARQATALGGSVVVLRGGTGLTRQVNAAALGDALPLMRAIKRQFDPTKTLNPGRFFGGV
jgi:glycolate oxidase FAD binding subunit